MTKEQMLELIKLLWVLEAWSFSSKVALPDYLHERVDSGIEILTEEILK